MSVERNASYNRSEHGETKLENYTLVNPENYTGKKEKIGLFFQVAIDFHPSHPQPKITYISYCALYRLLLAKPLGAIQSKKWRHCPSINK